MSDGIWQLRVVKCDARMEDLIASVGTKGAAPGQLNLPHSITADAKGNVYVADRSNRRIQVVFDNDLMRWQGDLRSGGSAPWAIVQ